MKESCDLRPEDFVRCYSPLQKADLILFLWRDPSSILKNKLEKIKNCLPCLRIPNDTEVSNLRACLLKQYRAIDAETIVRVLIERFKNDHLRKFEYAFYARCLARDDVAKRTIVDFGGGSNSFSTVVPMLFRLADTEIISVDLTHHNTVLKFGVRYVQGDCCNTGLPSASADVVSLISTLEHVGLGRYGDPLNVKGDIRCMEEAWRVLRPGGHVVLTIPYGFPTVVFNLHRIYDEGRFQMVTRGFVPVLIEYSRLGQTCAEADIEGAKAIVQIPGFYNADKRHPDAQGGVLALLRKP
jgi:SAM-dependent methyltransferase